MKTTTSAQLAIDRRLRRLDRGLAAGIDADAQVRHQTRVATRRLREALPLLTPSGILAEPDRRVLDDARKTIQTLTRALGGVREMDVALSIVDEFSAARQDLSAALAAVRSALEQEREKRLEHLRKRMEIRHLRKTSRLLAELARRAPAGGNQPSALASRIPDRARRLKDTVAQAGLLYAAERLHRVRIATKKLRYALELAEEVDGRRTRRLVTILRHMQDRLGRLHDLDVMTRFARAAFSDPRRPNAVRIAADAALEAFDHDIHERHADYIAHRHVLLEVAEAASVLARDQKQVATGRTRRTHLVAPKPSGPARGPAVK